MISALALASLGAANEPDTLPFESGEQLTFTVRTVSLGNVGHAVMSLSGPVDVRGVATLLASFDTKIGVAFMKGSDVSRSWIDPQSMSSLRFTKHTHSPFSSGHDSVEIDPAQRRWTGSDGESGTTATANPLDELSFIYFLRTVTFKSDSTYSFDRHYDTRRTPTTVRVVKHETLKTPAGTFATVELEMHVKDGTNYKGDGVLHLWFSEDRCHLPVQIESNMPVLGAGTLTLESALTPGCRTTGSTPVGTSTVNTHDNR